MNVLAILIRPNTKLMITTIKIKLMIFTKKKKKKLEGKNLCHLYSYRKQ